MPARIRSLLRSSQGLSLIEVLIVITILASLILISMINGPRFITKAHDTRRKSDLEAYKVAFEHYYEDNGCYPTEDELTSCSAPPDSLRPYLPKMLCDPQTKQPYVFDIQPGCGGFKVFTYLANGEDPDIDRIGCTVGCGIIGEDESFNYGVSSTGTRVGDPQGSDSAGGSVIPDDEEEEEGGPTPSGSSNPAGSSLGNETYLPLNCVLQPDGNWDCNCQIDAACGLGCPGNTLCSPDGSYCAVNTTLCPIGPQ